MPRDGLVPNVCAFPASDPSVASPPDRGGISSFTPTGAYRRVNLLFVSHCPPWPLETGNTQRVYHLLDGMTRRHDVTLVTLAPDSNGDESGRDVLDRCRRVIEVPFSSCRWRARNRFELLRWLLASRYPRLVHQWDSPVLRRVLAQLRRTERFDAVWVERFYTAEAVRRAGFDGRIFVDLDDLESVALARRLEQAPFGAGALVERLELAKIRLYERALPRRFWRLGVCKEEDRSRFGSAMDRVSVIPNGTRVFPPPDRGAERSGELLFVGQLEYGPNVDAIRYFHTEILPRLEGMVGTVRFVVVGRGGGPEILGLHDGDRCVVASSVPDLAPWFETAAVVVVPIRLGSGTRLKVLDGLSRGKAVVSTSVGAEGLDVRPGVDLEVADDADTFARTCARLLADPEARARLGRAGRERVIEKYRWDSVAETVEGVLAT